MLIVKQMSPAVQHALFAVVAVNPQGYPFNVQELSDPVSGSRYVPFIAKEWKNVVFKIGGEGDDDELDDDDDLFDGEGFVHISEPKVDDIFQETHVS